MARISFGARSRGARRIRARFISTDRFDNRLKLGEFARQLDVGVALGPRRQIVLDDAQPRHQRVKLGLGERNGHTFSGRFSEPENV